MKGVQDFEERQAFRQWWVWLLLLGMNGLFLFGCYKQLILGKAWGDRPTGDGELLLVTAGTVLISLFFSLLRLETRIGAEGIAVRFFPFYRNYRRIDWSELAHWEVRTYRPIAEFGGWGLRWGWKGGQAWNVAGNQGLQLVFKDGRKFLIGTQQPKALEDALHRIHRRRDADTGY